MRIGVSSQNFKTITAHPGKGRRFLVFEAGPDGQVRECARIELTKAQTLHETPGGEAHALDHLDVLLTGGAGAGFLNKMSARGVKVVMTALKDPLDAVQRYVRGEKLPAPVLDQRFSAHVQHRHVQGAHGPDYGRRHRHRDGHRYGHGDGHVHVHRHGGCGCTGSH